MLPDQYSSRHTSCMNAPAELQLCLSAEVQPVLVLWQAEGVHHQAVRNHLVQREARATSET